MVKTYPAATRKSRKELRNACRQNWPETDVVRSRYLLLLQCARSRWEAIIDATRGLRDLCVCGSLMKLERTENSSSLSGPSIKVFLPPELFAMSHTVQQSWIYDPPQG